LEAAHPNRLIVDKLLVGLKLWNGMDASAFPSEGVVVIDSDDFTPMSVDNVGTGNERYVGGAVVVIPFDVNRACGMSEDNTHIAASDATLLPATPPLAPRLTISMPGSMWVRRDTRYMTLVLWAWKRKTSSSAMNEPTM
jgi:hypothetical protein